MPRILLLGALIASGCGNQAGGGPSAALPLTVFPGSIDGLVFGQTQFDEVSAQHPGAQVVDHAVGGKPMTGKSVQDGAFFTMFAPDAQGALRLTALHYDDVDCAAVASGVAAVAGSKTCPSRARRLIGSEPDTKAWCFTSKQAPVVLLVCERKKLYLYPM